jgi:tetratricopeptide (TPR) repeat protein
LFFVNARFRLPVIPFIIIFASFAIYWLVQQLIKKDLKSLPLFFVIFIPFFLLTNSNPYRLDIKNYASSYFSLGNVYLKKGNLQGALQEYNKALEKDAYPVRVHLNKGIVFFKLGQFQEAEEEFLRELEVDPQDERAYNNLSVLYRLQGEYQKAIENAKESIQIKSYYPEAYINLTLAYKESGDLNNAREILDQALKIIPNFLYANFVLASLYQRQGKADSAISEYQKVASHRLQEKVVIYDLETLFAKEERTERSIKANAHYNLGLIYAERGDFNLAQINFLNAVDLNPDFAEAHANLGTLYDGLRRYPEALNQYEIAIYLDPENPVYHFNLGLVYAKINRLLEATLYFKKALEIDPGFTQAAEMLNLADSLLNTR